MATLPENFIHHDTAVGVASSLPIAVRVLVVDDDEDDYLIARDLLSEIDGSRFEVEWMPDPEAALQALAAGAHDICLLDYRLGRHNGLDVLRRAIARGVTIPIVLLTGQEDEDVDREAVRIGASDYLVKGRINSVLLDRAIRYARQQKQTLEALREQTEFVSAILDTAGALVVVLDRFGRIVRFNRQCEKTTGYTSAEVIGRVFWEFLLTAAEAERVCAVFRDLTGGLGPSEFENDWITRTGEARRVAWSNTSLLNTGDGSVAYVVSTGIDVTERRLAEEALAEAREREVEVGASIQRTLLVRKPPADLPGLEFGAQSMASQKIGGDYFDFFHFSDSVVDVLVGDVMGKGVPAALLAAATKNHFQRAVRRLGYALAPYGRLPDPEEIVAAVHTNLTRELVGLNSFVTLAYARFDLRHQLVTFVDCGHPRPLRVVAATGECQRLSGDNMPLGMNEGEQYRQVTIPCAGNDLFFFYSDGLTEAPHAEDDDELFGEDRLADVVAEAARGGGAAQVTEAAVAAVRAFSGDRATQSDDLTCVAVRVRNWDVPRRIVSAVFEMPSDANRLEDAREFVAQFCRNKAPKDAMDEESVDLLILAINEALANIIEHAYRGRQDGRIQVEAEALTEIDSRNRDLMLRELRFRLYDNGEAFVDREEVPDPSFDGTREDGFGLFIMEQCFDAVEHTRDELGRNCTTLTKRLIPV